MLVLWVKSLCGVAAGLLLLLVTLFDASDDVFFVVVAIDEAKEATSI